MSVIPAYASPRAGVTAGTRPLSLLVWNRTAPRFRGFVAFSLALLLGSWLSHGAESNAPPAAPNPVEETNSQQVLRTFALIQEQLEATRLAIEHNRQEAQQTAAQNAEALSNGLQVLQEALSAQRAREFEAMQSFNQSVQRSNKAMLVVAGTFAAIGFLAMLILTYFQWRTSNCLAHISTALPMSRGLGPTAEVAALGQGDWASDASDPAEQSNLRLLGALEQLDRRIHEFKRAISSGDNGDLEAAPDSRPGATASDAAPAGPHARISALLSKAYSMMNVENAEAAVTCFDEVLALDPNHTEALVKKGAALERLHKLNEAIECYDRAIALDGSMTLAHLHKGGLCNRLERFKEALECYEKALRTHDQRGG